MVEHSKAASGALLAGSNPASVQLYVYYDKEFWGHSLFRISHASDPKQSRPTRLRQQWFIYASLLTRVTERSLKKPVDVTVKQVYGEEHWLTSPQGELELMKSNRWC